jgi:hypothetical protein
MVTRTTAWFQTPAGRRSVTEFAHLRPFPARRSAASLLPFQLPSQQRSRRSQNQRLESVGGIQLPNLECGRWPKIVLLSL